jgi:hypothetical protein
VEEADRRIVEGVVQHVQYRSTAVLTLPPGYFPGRSV